MVDIIYGQESVQQIVVRYEAPVCGNRWDAPLHLVLRDGQIDCQVDISHSLSDHRLCHIDCQVDISHLNLIIFYVPVFPRTMCLRPSVTRYSTASLSNQTSQLKMRPWQVVAKSLSCQSRMNHVAMIFIEDRVDSLMSSW